MSISETELDNLKAQDAAIGEAISAIKVPDLPQSQFDSLTSCVNALSTSVGLLQPDIKPATPFDAPFPDYEIQVPIRDSYIAIVDAFKQMDKDGRKGQSVTLRFPEGLCRLPPSVDRSYAIDYTGRSDESTQVVFAGAKNGTTIIKGYPGSHTAPMSLPSYAVGTWRNTDMKIVDIDKHAMVFGTGPYNQKKHIAVLERIVARYCKGNFILAAQERAGPSTSMPSPMVVNDEIWMQDCDFRYNSYEHCVYLDHRAYVFGRRLKMYNGPLHAFKCIALKTELEDCEFFNVDPDTKDVVTIGPGVSDVFPQGATFYGRNANMSLVSACSGHVRRTRCLHAWPKSQIYDAGSDVIQREPRWILSTTNPELIDPTDEQWWIDASAAGQTDPANPYLLKHRWLWEDCQFDTEIRPDRNPPSYGICVVSATPITYNQLKAPAGPYGPIPVHYPDLWFNRSRDFVYNCQFTGNEKTQHFRQSPWFDTTVYADDWARCSKDGANLYKEFDTKPAWWPSDFDYHA